MRLICVSCGEVVFLNPKVVAAVVVEMDNKVVMVRRRTGVGAGKWSIPAGYVDRVRWWKRRRQGRSERRPVWTLR